jgi:uncharacterized protein
MEARTIAPTDDERQALLTAVQRVREATLRAARGPDSPPPAAVVQWLHQGLDRVWQRALSRASPLACTDGCSACCHAPVEVGAHEVSGIRAAIQRQPAQWQDALRQRLLRRDAEHGHEHGHEPGRPSDSQLVEAPASAWQDRPPCLLLDDDRRCGLYDARPAVCRKAHSLDQSACYTAHQDIPQDLALVMDAEALILGVQSAAQDLGAVGPRQDLTEVVRSAVTGSD